MKKAFTIKIKKKNQRFKKTIIIDADKSITHRALFLSSQCRGISELEGLKSEDIHFTIEGLRNLGVKILKKKICIKFTAMA